MNFMFEHQFIKKILQLETYKMLVNYYINTK